MTDKTSLKESKLVVEKNTFGWERKHQESNKNTTSSESVDTKVKEGQKLLEKGKEDLKKLNNFIVNTVVPNVRKGQRGWLCGEGICEWCGIRPARVNLNLTAGTHRECRKCWDN